ncbi:MAG: lipoprotein bor [Alphaproteobacteria bacterium GM202ARS2]|nr:lipoprotein bor [Alphaproteobacteria bacterium GM202ARS2]
MRKLFISCLVVVALSGCATQRGYLVNTNSGLAERKGTSHFFLGGVFQTDEINAARICRGASRVAQVRAEWTTRDAIIGLLTAGLYYPRSYTVYCRRR